MSPGIVNSVQVGAALGLSVVSSIAAATGCRRSHGHRASDYGMRESEELFPVRL